jgi:HK97 family phage portal protein
MNIWPFKQKSLVNTRDVGVIDTSWDIGWWQAGKNPLDNGNNAVVEACVQRIATAVSQMPITHFAIDDKGTRTRVLNSNPMRVLRRPNPNTTGIDFLYNAVRSLYLDGNFYAYCVRNARTEITEMWLLNPKSVNAYRLPEGSDIVYSVGDHRYTPANFDPTFFVPARDMLHVKLAHLENPLKGVPPIQFAAAQVSANNSIANKTAKFFENQGVPSGVLQTELALNQDQVRRLRDSWDAQSQGFNAGKTPILTSGLKWQQVSMSSQDAQLIEANNMTVQNISAVFGVPLALINSMQQATYNNTEQLISHWLATGLGWTVSLIEQALESAFELSADEQIDLDEKILLRANFKDRMDALGSGILNGIYAPNEARQVEGLAPIDGGDKPYLQQQMIPIGESPVVTQPGQPNPPKPAADSAQAKSVIKAYLSGKMRHA